VLDFEESTFSTIPLFETSNGDNDISGILSRSISVGLDSRNKRENINRSIILFKK
jgi:hypothetical protein